MILRWEQGRQTIDDLLVRGQAGSPIPDDSNTMLSTRLRNEKGDIGMLLELTGTGMTDIDPGRGATMTTMDASDHAAAMAVIQALVGPLPHDEPADARADRAIAVMHAQAAALTWVHQVTGSYPAPRPVATAIAAEAARLKPTETIPEHPDPGRRLIGIAIDAMSTYRTTAA